MCWLYIKKNMADTHRFALLVWLICISFFGGVVSESYEVTIQTLTTGTNGIIRIQFFGILGESSFVNAGDANYFSLPSHSKKAIVQTNEHVNSVLKISLTVLSGHAAHVGMVTVVEILTKRTITYNFGAFISEGMQVQRNSPSPDLFNPKILLVPENTSPASVTRSEGSSLHVVGDVKLNSTIAGNPSYRWFKRSLVSSPIPDEIGNSRDLLFQSIVNTDSARYFCVMWLGESVVKTEELNLVVDYLWMQPLQVIITGGSFIQEGNGVQIICSGSSNLANVIATWSKGEEVLQEGTVSLSYRFDRIHRNQSGVYKCKVRVNEETREQQFLVNVIYLDEPEIAAPHMVNKTAFISANQTAELSCHANGNPPADNYTVLEDGRQIQTYGERNHKFLVKKGGGNYTCITRNKYLQTQTTITVNATVFKGSSSTTEDRPSNDFWTVEMIVIVTIAIFLVILLILIIICVSCCCLKSKKRKKKSEHYVEKRPEITEENPSNIFYRPTEFQNGPYIDESLKQDHKDNRPASSKSQLSASSEEYISSTNDITSIATAQNNSVVANGKSKAEKPSIELSTVEHSTKIHKDKRKHKPRKHHSKHHTEEGEGSNWSHVNDSKAILNYHNNVEYF